MWPVDSACALICHMVALFSVTTPLSIPNRGKTQPIALIINNKTVTVLHVLWVAQGVISSILSALWAPQCCWVSLTAFCWWLYTPYLPETHTHTQYYITAIHSDLIKMFLVLMNTDSHPVSVDVTSERVGPALHWRGLCVSSPGFAEWPPRWPRRDRWWWQKGWTDLKVPSPSGAPEPSASLPERSGSPDCATFETQKYKQKNNPCSL